MMTDVLEMVLANAMIFGKHFLLHCKKKKILLYDQLPAGHV